jgi:hypothetical protein
MPHRRTASFKGDLKRTTKTSQNAQRSGKLTKAGLLAEVQEGKRGGGDQLHRSVNGHD